ncbi:MAG: hypothetical protein KDJ65_07800 [Anaerolineae bacterium]|nr:hypothetical protein [Anaerolineae bacterium]
MCNIFTTLAVSNDRRLIVQCEHGTVHLTWDTVTMHLSPVLFHEMSELLMECSSTSFTQIRRQRCLMNYFENHKYYQLWFQGVALNLAPVDFIILVDMVTVALAEMEKSPTDQPSLSGSQSVDEQFKTIPASPGALFSLN